MRDAAREGNVSENRNVARRSIFVFSPISRAGSRIATLEAITGFTRSVQLDSPASRALQQILTASTNGRCVKAPQSSAHPSPEGGHFALISAMLYTYPVRENVAATFVAFSDLRDFVHARRGRRAPANRDLVPRKMRDLLPRERPARGRRNGPVGLDLPSSSRRRQSFSRERHCVVPPRV